MAYSPTHSVLQFYSSNKCTFTHTFTNSFSVTVHQTSARSLTHSPTPCYNFIHQTSARSLIHSPAHCYNFIHQTSARSLTHSPTHSLLQLYSPNKCTFTNTFTNSHSVTIVFTKQVHVHSYNFIHEISARPLIHSPTRLSVTILFDSVLQFYSPNSARSLTHSPTRFSVTILFTKQVHFHSHIHSQSISHSVSRSLINSLTRSLTLNSLTCTFLAFSTVPMQQQLPRQSRQSLETGTGTSIITLPFNLSSARCSFLLVGRHVSL